MLGNQKRQQARQAGLPQYWMKPDTTHGEVFKVGLVNRKRVGGRGGGGAVGSQCMRRKKLLGRVTWPTAKQL